MSLPNQKGQALLMMLGFVLVLAVAFIYLFNTSQLLAERTQAKVLADHAAYNTAVKQAQLLNANAYMNKAKIANQLATAQAVSVGSWVRHFQAMPQNTQAINLIPVVGPPVQQAITTSTQALQNLSPLPGLFIPVNNVATQSISMQQTALNNASILAIRQMHEVTLNQSSIGAGFDSQPLEIASKYAFNPASNFNTLLDENFIKQYQGDSNDSTVGRDRLKDVVLASLDDFTRQRRADNTSQIPIFRTLTEQGFNLQARGGTEISNDLNHWKGVDTFSLHYLHLSCGWTSCSWEEEEAAIGYGSAVVSDKSGDDDPGNRAGYDGANVNREASSQSHQFRPQWDTRDSNQLRVGESGIPKFWDLDTQFLQQEEPTLPVAIRVSKTAIGLDTTSGISEFKVGDTVNIASGDAITALSTAEVYFERPLKDRDGRDIYFNKNRLEKASLFNPYWHVRLTNNSREALLEGAVRANAP